MAVIPDFVLNAKSALLPFILGTKKTQSYSSLEFYTPFTAEEEPEIITASSAHKPCKVYEQSF